MTTTADTIKETREYKGFKVEIAIDAPFTTVKVNGWPILFSSSLTAKFDTKDDKFILLSDADGNHMGFMNIEAIYLFLEEERKGVIKAFNQ